EAGGSTASAAAALTVRFAYASVTVTPNSVTLTSLNDTAQLSAVVRGSGGTVVPQARVSWSSGGAAVSVDTMGRAVARMSTGTPVTVTANSRGVTGTAGVVVQQRGARLVPVPSSLRFASLGDAATLQDTAFDAHDSIIAPHTTSWTSDNPGVASVTSGGRVTAIANGSTKIRGPIDARSGAGGGSANGTAQVVVRFKLDSLRVAPANPKFNRLGDTLTFTASGTDSLGSTIANPQVSWISRAPARLTIDAVTGLARAVDTGNVIFVVATHDNAADSATAQVSPPVLVADTTFFFADSL